MTSKNPKNIIRSGFIYAFLLCLLCKLPLQAHPIPETSSNIDSEIVQSSESPESTEAAKARTLNVGDRLYYSVVEDRQDRKVLFVNEQGSIAVPLVGSLQAQGVTHKQLAKQIKEKLEANYYSRATVIVSPYRESNERGKVFLLGQIEQQGPVEIPNDQLLTVTKAVLLAGGFTRFSDTTSVTVTRRDPINPENEIKAKINVREILERGDLDQDMVLQGGDVIFVPEKGEVDAKVFVIGEIRAPGYYSIPPGRDFTVSQAILQAGGFSEFADQDEVKLVRADTSLPEEERTVIINAEKIFEEGDRTQDLSLGNNDMIIIDEKWINF